ncbi:hypothetical protein WN944_022418 [Citrus x changshan-huyou]|uniref:AB hydrolase-1 domain-containing protein n=1 Tax=Citrus x changshan-huyou TaxID=2935761 RepID=A0AAP0R369_9ROSI
MASWTLFSPPCSPVTLPTSSAAKTNAAGNNKCYCFWRSSSSEKKRAIRRIITKATEEGESSSSSGSKDEETPGFNPFGFVNNNPSSRSAIQLPDLPADDGNVSSEHVFLQEILTFSVYLIAFHMDLKIDKIITYLLFNSRGLRIRDGSMAHTSNLGNIDGSADSRLGTIVFLHGAPSHSYSYRNVMSQMSDAGFHCFAPDWLGFGFSDKPEKGYDDFDFTENEFHEELDKLLDVLEVKYPFFLVVQVNVGMWRLTCIANLSFQILLKGFLVGSYGLTWALKNPSRISKLAILNSPLTASSPLPGLFQQLRIPLLGEFTAQNAIMAERFIEAGSPYVLKLDKADVYRLPYLASSGPGFALLEAARKVNFKDISSRIGAGFSSGRYNFWNLFSDTCSNKLKKAIRGPRSPFFVLFYLKTREMSWDKPVLVAWGISDKYLPQSVAEEFQKGNPNVVKLQMIEGAGHMPQEDWPEKVVDALRYFFLNYT